MINNKQLETKINFLRKTISNWQFEESDFKWSRKYFKKGLSNLKILQELKKKEIPLSKTVLEEYQIYNVSKKINEETFEYEKLLEKIPDELKKNDTIIAQMEKRATKFNKTLFDKALNITIEMLKKEFEKISLVGELTKDNTMNLKIKGKHQEQTLDVQLQLGLKEDKFEFRNLEGLLKQGNLGKLLYASLILASEELNKSFESEIKSFRDEQNKLYQKFENEIDAYLSNLSTYQQVITANLLKKKYKIRA